MAITTPSWNVNLGLAQPLPAAAPKAEPVGGAGPEAWWNPLSGGPSQPGQPNPIFNGTPVFNGNPSAAGGELSQLAGEYKTPIVGAVAGYLGRDSLVRHVSRRSYGSRDYGAGSRNYSYGTAYHSSRRARSSSSGPRVRIGGEGALANFLNAAKISALVGAGLSLIQHGGAYMRGQTTFAVAAAEVTNDTASAALSGFAGAAASTAACGMLAGVVGTGLGLTLVGLVAGIAAYSVVDSWFRGTEVSMKLRSTVHNLLA